MKKVVCFALMMALCLVGSNLAQAAVTDVQVVQVDNSAGGAPLANFVTNDILISFDGQYTGAQILLEPSSAGGIYQDGVGGDFPPNSAFFPTFPALEFDTYLTQGNDGNPSLGGGAVDLGAAPAPQFDTDRISQAFNPAGGTTIADKANFRIARITLRDDVSTTALLLSSAGNLRNVLEGTVENGVLSFIPEPSSIILGTFGFLSIFGLRRRS